MAPFGSGALRAQDAHSQHVGYRADAALFVTDRKDCRGMPPPSAAPLTGSARAAHAAPAKAGFVDDRVSAPLKLPGNIWGLCATYRQGAALSNEP